MYAKIFAQIFDSSIAEDWQIRHVFEDLLKLCDPDGVVDMTLEAIARRSNTPLEIVKRAIAELEKPDPKSRSANSQGRRIIRIDEHRDWGWIIVNYQRYREIASDEQRRANTAARTRRWREREQEKNKENSDEETARDAVVTHGDAGDAKQRKRKRKKQKQDSEEDRTAGFRVRSNRPRCFGDVVRFYLTDIARYERASTGKWTREMNWERPASELIGIAGSYASQLAEHIKIALRFVRYNNSNGWQVHDWRTALHGFADRASAISGASEVPEYWVPRIE